MDRTVVSTFKLKKPTQLMSDIMLCDIRSEIEICMCLVHLMGMSVVMVDDCKAALGAGYAALSSRKLCYCKGNDVTRSTWTSRNVAADRPDS
jgi:hypothetical protein